MNTWEETDIKRLQREISFERHERSYKLLFIHFYKSLTRFAFSYVKSQEAAEEIVSDIMLKLWNMQEKLAGVENLKVYLYTATRNASLNYLSKNSRYPEPDIEHIEVELNLTIYNPEDILLQDELRKKVAAAIRSLPPRCQMVYKLVREDGLTYREVAAVLDIAVNTVDRHLNIALHKLADSVQTYLRHE